MPPRRRSRAADRASSASLPDPDRWRARRGSGLRGASNAWASPRRCRIPSEYLPTRRPGCCLVETDEFQQRFDHRSAATPMVWRRSASASRPRRPACCADASSRIPTRWPGVRQVAVAIRRTSAPARCRAESPTSIRIVVVFPAPFGPEEASNGARLAAECDVGDDRARAASLVRFAASIITGHARGGQLDDPASVSAARRATMAALTAMIDSEAEPLQRVSHAVTPVRLGGPHFDGDDVKERERGDLDPRDDHASRGPQLGA